MSPLPRLAHAALLLLDFQNDILDRNLPGPERYPVLERNAAVLAAFRAVGLPVLHVVVRFRPGHPEISGRDAWRRGMRGTQRLIEGTPGANIAAALAPIPGEIVVVKRRTGAFSTTDLAAVLSALEVDTLVIAGVSTGGSVLTTVRDAADRDFAVLVLEDCCADPDEQVHRILCDKVFPRQATVTTAAEFLAALSAGTA